MNTSASTNSIAQQQQQQQATDTNLALNFAGLTHDHTLLADYKGLAEKQEDAELCSVIAILRRHPMYDCLILVKKYRHCLQGHSLEFPLDKAQESELEPTNESPIAERQRLAAASIGDTGAADGQQQRAECSKRRLVSRFLDGDDPIFGACCSVPAACAKCADPTQSPFIVEQLDEQGKSCELVHVPVNGLLDRLAAYTARDIAVDSRVYAFAMGLKTAERIISTKSMKELQETPL